MASGLVWSACAVAEMKGGVGLGFAVLFFGGMLIFPISLVLARAVFRRARPQEGNGLIPIALESTAAMIAGLLAAYLLLDHSPGLVFAVSALAVGTHYFAFRTLYGDTIFLILGAVITALGLNAVFGWIVLPGALPWWVAGVELAFGVLMTARSIRHSPNRQATS
jgi:hypothetical protein